MIKEMKPLSLVETKDLIGNEEVNDEIKDYFKKFIKLKKKDVEKMKKELEDLNNHKIKSEDIVKVIDFLPEDASDINKIFIDVSLEEDEIKKISEIVKKYK